MLRKSKGIVLLACAATSVIAGAAVTMADQGKERNGWTIADLTWMAGNWEGEALGGLCEEFWLPPEGKVMACVYRLTTDGRLRVVELATITETDAGITFFLRHYDQSLVPWEKEPLRYDLVDLSGTRAVFASSVHIPGKPDRIIYSRVGADSLLARVEGLDDDTGEEDAFEIPMRRKATEAE
jgi:hypothetical protein